MLKKYGKIEHSVIALLMVCVLVFTLAVDVFVSIANSFDAHADEKATPGDAKETGVVSLCKEMFDEDLSCNPAGIIVKIYKDSTCSDSDKVADGVLSYDGKIYSDSNNPAIFYSADDKGSAVEKEYALEYGEYYYKLDGNLCKSDEDFSSTGYDYCDTVKSFTVNSKKAVIKLDNSIFKIKDNSIESTESTTATVTESETDTEKEVEPKTDVKPEVATFILLMMILTKILQM